MAQVGDRDGAQPQVPLGSGRARDAGGKFGLTDSRSHSEEIPYVG